MKILCYELNTHIEDCSTETENYVFRKDIMNYVMRDYNGSSCVGHKSTRKTLELVKHYYWWPCMDKDLIENVYSILDLKYDIIHYLGFLQYF